MFKTIEPSKIMKGIKFYIVEDLAKILDLTPGAVRKYLRNGRIASVKVGQRFWVSEKNLNNFLICQEIRDLSDEQIIAMINRAVEIKFKEWSDEAIPKMQKVVADFLLKKEKERDKEKEEFKEEMKLVYSIYDQLKKVLPKKVLPGEVKNKEHIRYKEKELQKV